MTEQRANRMNDEAIINLITAAQSREDRIGVELGELGLDPALSVEEVEELGHKVFSRVEAIMPSRDGCSNGRKARLRVYEYIVQQSIATDDRVTARSGIEALRTNNGLLGKLSALVLKKTLNWHLSSLNAHR